MTLALRPYQEVGRDFLAARRHALLADEMRVGKTPQAILAAAKLGVDSALVVCPAIAVPQWQAEWRRWHPGPLPRKLEVVSYDKAKRDAKRLKLGYWDVVVVDEAHFAKNPEAERTKLIYGKDGLGWHASRLWALSGTPATKHAGELWPMLRAFGVVGMTFSEFTQRYCQHDWTGRIVGTNVARIPELKAILAKIMLRRTRKEVAPELADIEFDFLNIAEADVDLPEGALDALAAEDNTSLQQERIAVAMAKAPTLENEIVFAVENELLEKAVVFGWHIEPLTNLSQRLQARGIGVGLITGKTTPAQRQWVQERFKDGSIRVVIANILAAGTAIDLSAASHGYFLELDWVPGNNMQAANRLVSMEKKEPVSFDVLTWPGSMDDRVQKVLLTRAQQLAKLYS